MTDADALSELVRVGLRNPARIVVKVQTKKVAKRIPGKDTPKSQIIEERRTPAKYLLSSYLERHVSRTNGLQSPDLLHQLPVFRETGATCSNN